MPSLPSAALRKIWKAPTLPRCRETGWRACLGALPVREVLHACGLELDSSCTRCHEAPETVHHALLFCPMVQATWFASNLGLRLQQERKFHDFMLEFLQVADEERLGVFLEILYAIWTSRNELVFQNAQGTLDQMLRKASLLHPGPAMVTVPTHLARQHPTYWSRPAPGLYKINFDASVTQKGSGGFGFIARDVQAEVLAAACWHYGPVTTPTMAKALSMRWSMTLARDLGFRRVVFETDCLPLVEAWKRNGGCSFLDSIVRDCNFLLSNFEVFSLLFVRRTGNCAADALASLSFSFGEVVWIEEVPPQLIDIVQSDVLTTVSFVSS